MAHFFIQPSVEDKNEVAIFSSGLSNNDKKLTMAFQIPREEEAVVSYNLEVLGENYNTSLPLLKFLIKTENTEGHALYRELVLNELENITINVDVRGIKSLELESDIGTLNAEKPFYPFSTQPVRKSNFYINYPELFKKEWKKLNVDIEWKNTPIKSSAFGNDAFVDLYFAYRTNHLYQTSSSNYVFGMITPVELLVAKFEEESLSKKESLMPELDEQFKIQKESVIEQIAKAGSQVISQPSNLIVKSDEHFTANIEIQNKEEWELVDNDLVLFNDQGSLFKTEFEITNSSYTTDKNGPVRLSLNKPFYHGLFPRIYALAFSSEDKSALIPNEPYTPFVESIQLNYTAQSAFNTGASKQDYQTNEIKLFHEHPFGQSEEHAYLRAELDFISTEEKKNYAVPTYCKGGELFIGLEQVAKLQQVSLLVQVLEGSENPLADSFTGKQKVEWYVLCQNQWKTLNSDYMISNETDNFLKSGIVKFAIPKEANADNTILPAGLVWVKAKIHKNYDAVCKTIDIIAQSVLAEFENNENDLAHLENGIEAKTISKLIQRVPSIKSISQPFNSFDGKPEESDAAYYRRISERLRHKNRAITLWDYEHIILQEFPEIHKVKCLNHSKTEIVNNKTQTSFLSPGEILIVVIPDIINKNVFDIYQPRVSTATLNEVQNWVNKLNTLHVNAKIINPDYEEVTIDLKVKFHKGFDENYYSKVLNSDLTKLLSPWAFEDSASIKFGITLHRSVVINYIEKLDYVDYIAEVKLLKGEEVSISSVAPSSPKAILVSAKEHNISTNVSKCKGITETAETCQT